MYRDKTGRRYEAHGDVKTLEPLFKNVKDNYPDARLLTAPSDNIAVIGSDDHAAIMLITLKAHGPVVTIDRENYQYRAPYQAFRT